MKQSDINPEAKKAYREALAKKLKKIDPELSDKKAAEIARLMSKKSPDQLRDELSKAKYGKKYFSITTTWSSSKCHTRI